MNINKNKSIILMLVSSFTFSSMQIIVKLLPNIPLIEKVFFRNLISILVAFYILRKNNLSFFGLQENRKYLFYRFIFGFAGIILFFYATTQMLTADAAMLNKLSPIFVTVLAHFFLKERINKIQITSLIISLIGASLVIKPEFNSAVLPAIAGLLSAVVSGAAYIFITSIGKKENVYTIVFFFSFFSALSCLPFFYFEFIIPNIYELSLLLLLGLLAAIGQVALTCAYNNCQASEISIYDYSNIVFSFILAYIFLSEIPDILSTIGGTLIISASFILFLYNKRN
ncbi:DMT family transporter [Sedimentibacter sp. MB31-C6]|uniref:DMT family transporter n=1 Tax=Sedimentibacter sp. MB31-C6 TaxID=3109366 RepID=UPI002DDCECA7|nr:DMT family transporter [Sedimentibacter sp. MB36-C1]WSI04867.1 DMT family transporter [Sedimentibacter sp. MB36-C1]